MTILFRLLGLLICLLVIAQLAVYLLRSVTHYFAELNLRRLRVEKLREEISGLRSRRSRQTKETSGWNGFRKFRVAKKERESDGCHSFYLAPHDGKPLPSFRPGQYLTFQLKVPGQKKPVIRCYSLSAKHDERFYRCTIKKMLPPNSAPDGQPGISSTYFNDVVKEGDILDVKAPCGNFFLDESNESPVVLIAGGVGITPMMAMAETLIKNRTTRPIHLFVGFPNGPTHIFKTALEQMEVDHPSLRLTVCYSEPLETDRLDHDYHVAGRITIPMLRAALPSTNCDFYLCGPGPMMEALTQGLAEWGVEESRINTEAFGPSSVKKRKRAAIPAAVAVGAGVGTEAESPGNGHSPTDSAVTVSFDRSGKQLSWNDDYDSLLEFAESHGIEIEAGCRAGNCGTCVTAVKTGKVKYAEQAGADCEDGTCLPCICIPDQSLTLDA